MSNQQTEAHDPESGEDEAENRMEDVRSRAETVVTNVTERSPDGALLLVAGGVLLAGAIWSERRIRAVIQAFIGAGLVGLGLRKRRAQADEHQPQDVQSVEFSESGTVEERIESHQEDENPRSPTEVPGEEAEPDEGEIQFTEDQTDEPRSEPTLDESTPEDPRHEDDDEVTEIDISEASMADEASEAVGPTPEQAQPVQTDDTEPESTPPEDQPQHDDDQTNGSETTEDEDSDDTATETAEGSGDSNTAEDEHSDSDNQT